jgi:hypothetical protein
MKSTTPKKQPQQLSDLPEKIWPEKNIEKWSIWIPANSRSSLRARTFKRTFELPDGMTVVAKLKIGFTDEGTLTTDEQRVYYALVKLWEDHRREDDDREEQFTPFSLARLARLLRLTWGRFERKRLIRALMRLRTTPLIWENAYIDAVKDTRLDLLHPFTILDDLKIAKRRTKGKRGVTELGYFRFHENILKNLVVNYTTPLFLDVVLSFKSEIAQILYTHLDLILWDKTSYERRTRELFEDLGLEGTAYKNLSDRKRVLDRALKELQGKPITTGKITTAKLVRTKDGADLKLVVRKGKATEAITTEAQSNVLTFPVPAEKDEPPNEAEELVKHFHKVFHGAEEAYPTTKAIDQAATLIARHGVAKARHIIDFAKREATKTQYKVATFGGIMQYEALALRDFEKAERDRQQQRTDTQARIRKQQAANRKRDDQASIDAYLKTLDADGLANFDAEAWEQATPEMRESVETATLANVKRVQLKFIREAHARRVLNLPPAPHSE